MCEAIENFVLATAVPGIEAKLEILPPELTWGYHVLGLLAPSLAEALPGGTIKQSLGLGTKHVYIGCNVYFMTPEGERCVCAGLPYRGRVFGFKVACVPVGGRAGGQGFLADGNP